MKGWDKQCISRSLINCLIVLCSLPQQILTTTTHQPSNVRTIDSEPLLRSMVPGPPTNSPIFGAKLEDAIRISHIPDKPLVPAVLYRCAVFLEAKGVDEVGLYR